MEDANRPRCAGACVRAFRVGSFPQISTTKSSRSPPLRGGFRSGFWWFRFAPCTYLFRPLSSPRASVAVRICEVGFHICVSIFHIGVFALHMCVSALHIGVSALHMCVSALHIGVFALQIGVFVSARSVFSSFGSSNLHPRRVYLWAVKYYRPNFGVKPPCKWLNHRTLCPIDPLYRIVPCCGR